MACPPAATPADHTGQAPGDHTGPAPSPPAEAGPPGRTAGATTAAEDALHELIQLPDARYEEMLAVPAAYAMRALGAHAASLSRWERDRGLLRTLVNVGTLGPHESPFPREETYQVASDGKIGRVLSGQPTAYHRDDPQLDDHGRATLAFSGKQSALSLPLMVDDRIWGELWLSRDDPFLVAGQLLDGQAVAEDVARMVAVAERLQHMARLAFEDPLTGVGNRRVLDDALSELLGDQGTGTTVVICDIDNLKDLNDEFGHGAGDRAIVAVADALATAASRITGAVTVRLGGDEFAVLLAGEQRARAIGVVECASRLLQSGDHPVEISCGIAVVPAGLPARDALAAADAAQYAAKTRGALLVVSSDLTAPPAERRRGRRRSSDRALAQPLLVDGVAQVVADLADGLRETPDSVGGRLRWLAERLLAPLDLQLWSLSHVDLAGERFLRTDSLGLRDNPITNPDAYNVHVDTAYHVDDYPLSLQAITQDGWFSIRSDDTRADDDERLVLHEMGMRYLIALGCSDGTDGWLLELYARSAALDTRLVGHLLALGASALLYRPFVPIGPVHD